MCETESEIYVVSNDVDIHRTENVYVGAGKEKAQKLCDKHQSKEHPCFIEVWEDGHIKYTTRAF